MKKEEIYLDLSKLSEIEKEYVKKATGRETENRNFIHFLEEKNKWISFHTWEDDKIYKTEITFNQFKELFNTIQLDKTKAYDLRDLNEDQLQEFRKEIELYSDLKGDETDIIFYECGTWWWNTGKFNIEDREVINALTLFEPQLKIGDTFEHNGFICEVKEPVKRWCYNKEFNMYIKTSDVREFVTEITDQEFINQLEKHAR